MSARTLSPEALRDALQRVQSASRALATLPADRMNTLLHATADAVVAQTASILAANAHDLARMDAANPKYDRLMLTEARIHAIADDMRNVAALPTPLGHVLEDKMLDNGLHLQKITVPLGVVGVIYEARSNVTLDVFALCMKSGNACVLKGGSDAQFSNEAVMNVIHTVLEQQGLTKDVAYLMPAGREATDVLFHAVGVVDVIIPRGSQSLIDTVRMNSKVPVIETGAGIVHTYFDASGDLASGAEIIFNAKTRRVSVCNALDTLLVHRSRLQDLPALVDKLHTKNVTIYADAEAYEMLQNTPQRSYPVDLLKRAQPEHFGTEFLDYKMSVKTVGGLDEALDHIAQHSSKHSEAVIASDEAVVERFLASVDAAAVYANASTAFTDGSQFGLGAEIGISTQKLHARGPMALKELTSYKWLVRGAGQVRA
jgi:glutamate-5-semialdehyde dehydrogenase